MHLDASGIDPSEPTPVDPVLIVANRTSYRSKQRDLTGKIKAFLEPIVDGVEVDPTTESVQPVRDLLAQYNRAWVCKSEHPAGRILRTAEKIGAYVERLRDPSEAIISGWHHRIDADNCGASISLHTLDFDSKTTRTNSRAVTYGGGHEAFPGEAANFVMICYPSLNADGKRQSEIYVNLLQLSEGAFDLSLGRANREGDKLELAKEETKSAYVAKVELVSLVAKHAIRFSTEILNRENQAAIGMTDITAASNVLRLGIVSVGLGDSSSRWTVVVPEMLHHKFEVRTFLDKYSILKCDLVSHSAESFCGI